MVPGALRGVADVVPEAHEVLPTGDDAGAGIVLLAVEDAFPGSVGDLAKGIADGCQRADGEVELPSSGVSIILV